MLTSSEWNSRAWSRARFAGLISTAILKEFIEKGPTDISITQIAKRAGVSVGSLYQYFKNRAGLLAFVTELASQLAKVLLQGIQHAPCGIPVYPFNQGERQWYQNSK